ncbi:hypothetical protein [Rahnella victoriana]|uniref:hypothetical protein n=1 Tax=Rahnella victoriana TaxID=1510570 RepID=UPI001E36EC78|nr:hypothetical protein [Rahnella victoriana]UHM93656.1 hypothetical protein J9880_24710 [Rahnella victoriana]
MYNAAPGSYASPDSVFAYKGLTGSNRLTGYYKEGVSGSAVFLRSNNCLAGIVSKKDRSSDAISDVYKTDFVIVDMIKKFLHDNRIIILGGGVPLSVMRARIHRAENLLVTLPQVAHNKERSLCFPLAFNSY